MKLAIYLKKDKRIFYLAKATAFDCYEKIIEFYADEYVDKAIEAFTANLSYCLRWLYASLKAFCSRPIESKSKQNLTTFPRELFEEAFKILEDKIEKQTGSIEEAREVNIYLKLLLKQLWS